MDEEKTTKDAKLEIQETDMWTVAGVMSGSFPLFELVSFYMNEEGAKKAAQKLLDDGTHVQVRITHNVIKY